MAVPALTALVASQAAPAARGAVLGGLQTLQELASAVGYPLYGRLLARGLTGGVPGAPFFAAPRPRSALRVASERCCDKRSLTVNPSSMFLCLALETYCLTLGSPPSSATRASL